MRGSSARGRAGQPRGRIAIKGTAWDGDRKRLPRLVLSVMKAETAAQTLRFPGVRGYLWTCDPKCSPVHHVLIVNVDVPKLSMTAEL